MEFKYNLIYDSHAPSWDKIFGGRSKELVSGFKFQEVRYLKYETGKNTTLKNIL